MQLRGRMRARHAEGEGMSSVLQKGKKKCNLQNRKLRPKPISFRRPRPLVEAKLETSAIFREELKLFCSKTTLEKQG